MSPISAIIFGAFGALWVVFGILSQPSPAPLLCIFPICIAAVLIGRTISAAKKMVPLIAVSVGLHFLPFARYVADWRYYSMALVLWTSSIMALREQQRSPQVFEAR